MPASIYCFDGWRLDSGRRTLSNPEGRLVRMTSHEIDMLVIFCKNPQKTLSRNDLAPRVNGKVLSFERSVDVRIVRIRQKIEVDSRTPEIIKTIRQGGYWFAPDVTVA
jgi:two-component system OmpR family response regulator